MGTLKTFVTTTVATSKLFVKKHAPEILIGAGIIGGVATVVLACTETLHAEEVLDIHTQNIETIHNAEKQASKGIVVYTEDDKRKDLVLTYANTAKNFAKLYLPSIALGTASVGLILWGAKIQKARYLGAVAAYAALDERFQAYKMAVDKTYGEGTSERMELAANDIIQERMTKTVIDEDGTVNTKATYTNWDIDRLFEETNRYWVNDATLNCAHIKGVQTLAQAKLDSRGYLFLNEVYDALGFPKTRAGQVVGWVKSKGSEPTKVIDFGISPTSYGKIPDSLRRFLDGNEPSVFLHFNVDGPILFRDDLDIENA